MVGLSFGSLPAQAGAEEPTVYTFADGVSLNFRTSLGRVSFVPLFTDREHLRRDWVRISDPVRSARISRTHSRDHAWLTLTAAPTAQALAADTRRRKWFADRRDMRQWQRGAYESSMEAAAHMAARDGAAQEPGVKDALLPAANAAFTLGTRISDGFLGLWDRALAMMPEGASPARKPQVFAEEDSILLCWLYMRSCQTAAACVWEGGRSMSNLHPACLPGMQQAAREASCSDAPAFLVTGAT